MVLKERRSPEPALLTNEADRLELTFYADPLCCWSWVLLPEIEKAEQQFSGALTVSVCLGGMIAKWSGFSDPLHAVSRPAQMGPLWLDAAEKTGIPFRSSVWVDDPPASSYPACLAIKTAELQSALAGRVFMKRLMEALMIHGRNIAEQRTLLEIATETEQQDPSIFSTERFLANYNREESRSAFLRDLQACKMNQVGRFPTVTITGKSRKGIIFTGYRPYQTVVDALFAVAPELRT